MEREREKEKGREGIDRIFKNLEIILIQLDKEHASVCFVSNLINAGVERASKMTKPV